MIKKYDIIYADPPWTFNNKNTGGSMVSGADAHYSTMTVEDIRKLPIKKIIADDCILVMWWVASQPLEALSVVDAWGFKLKTMVGFNWVKKTKNGKPHFGMGFWTRAGSECSLIAVKGKPKRLNAAIRAVVEAEAEAHSKKPAIFRELIALLMGENKRKLELFARERSEGWDVFGDEVPGSIELQNAKECDATDVK